MNDIERISPLVKKAARSAERSKKLESDLKAEKQLLRRLLDVDIPELMTELGLVSITTDEGSKVEVQQFVDARIPISKQAQAFGWLRENGFGDLIKHQVISQFGTGEDAEAEAAALYLEGCGYATTNKLSVHPQTLKAWAREQDEHGTDIPDDLFGIYRGMTTKIK